MKTSMRLYDPYLACLIAIVKVLRQGMPQRQVFRASVSVR